MRVLKAILLFYQKLVIPSLIVSGLLGLVAYGVSGQLSLKTIGFSYIITSLLFHYFIYEVMYSDEYYFYYNLGLSRLNLWIITLVLSLLIGVLFMLL